MKIELVRVTHKRTRPWQVFLQTLTLSILAALTPRNIEVRITDERTESIDYESDADLIGLTYFTADAHRAYKTADEFRKRGKFVVMGGPHASRGSYLSCRQRGNRRGRAGVWRDLLGDFSLNRAGDTELLKLAAQGGCIRMGLRFEASYL